MSSDSWDSHPCGWKPTASGRYVREQDTREKLVLRQVRGVAGHINYHMVFSVTLQYSMPCSDAESRVRAAWISLRCAQPSIAAVAEDNCMTFAAIRPEDVDAWVSNTFFVHETADSALSLSSELQPAVEMQLHFLPRSKELMLCASHEHADGHGMIMLLDTICENIAFPSLPVFENQAERLSPPLDIAARIGAASPRIWDQTTKLMKEWGARAARPLYIKADRQGPSVGTVSTSRLVLSDKNSSAILRWAKARGLSVNDAMNGAVVMATKRYGNTEGNWLGGVMMDARNQIPTPYNARKHAATIFFVACPAFVENPQSVVDAATQIQKQRVAFQQDPEALQILQPMLAMATSSNSKIESKIGTAASQSQVEYSGLGNLSGFLEQAHGSIEIVDFWLTLGHCNNSIGVYCYTFRRKLNFSCSYNSGFHSKRNVDSFIRILKTLLEGLYA
ncbi:cytochrome p450 [Colletotrichum plurivorum]|uniref:Cytochrome p450 n=1 Tax=Colletotrichum plurivorum TaxID=2175906 RepID=A0A8H6K2G9_9PEZI|nr:cytochrome p450 [Colletotrichum plurivorum]